MTDRFDRSPLVDAAARAPCRIVVSGFGPWGALPGNPTLAVLDRLAAEAEGADLTTLALSVDTARVDALVTRTLDEIRPRLWIGLGLAVGRRRRRGRADRRQHPRLRRTRCRRRPARRGARRRGGA